MRQAGLLMGIFWVGLGIFLLISNWLGKSSYYIPKINIGLGWVVLVLGIWRIWWWWKTEEEPRRRRESFEREQRQMMLELYQTDSDGYQHIDIAPDQSQVEEQPTKQESSSLASDTTASQPETNNRKDDI